MGQFADLYQKQLQKQRQKLQGIQQPLEDPSGFNATYQDEEGSIYDQDLIQDRNYVKASKLIYHMNNGKDAEALSDEDYAKWGIEHMGWFNWNLPKMTLDASRISGATDEQKQAFLYMMESYDDLGASWNGAGRFFKGVFFDPTTWIGLTTFGIGLAGKEATKQASKQGVKELLKSSIRGGIIAGVESGVYTAVDDVNRQVVETSVSGEDIDVGRVIKSGAIGATAGLVLGTGITAGVNKLASRKSVKEVAESVDESKLINDLPELETGVVIDTPKSPAGRLRTHMDNVIKAVKRTVPAGKVAAVGTDGVQNMDGLVQTVEPIKQLLADASVESPGDLSAYLMKQGLTDGQGEVLEVATSQTVTALKTKVYNLRLQQKALDGDEAIAIGTKIDEIEEVIAPLDELDAAMSTITGQRLRARQESMNTGELRGTTISSLVDQGLTRADAEKQFDSIFAEKLIKHERTAEVRTLNKKIEETRKSGDTSEYLKLKHEKKTKVAEFKQEVIKEESFTGAGIYEAFNKPIRVLNEIVIGNVFSPATQIINTVPSLAKAIYKPFLNNLMQDGLSRVSRKKMMAEYSAMASLIPSAAKMAKAAWRYEKTILTGDSARFLENYNTIPKKYGGGVVRTFPRMLLATDAFFENIHYRGYVVGKATGDAMEAGVAKGLKGKELDTFVDKQVKKAVDKAYAPEENAIDILMSDGISRGYKGKKLENFINKELAENPDVFKKATDQDGRDYVQDTLFKRDFSGKGSASALAKGYEGLVNKHPVMRILGQLFFRTPVRVFEEGIRMTPGLNLISPGFIKDLKGLNGPMRQARAHGEALMSYAAAGSVFSMYSTGNITGSMGTDYKQTRQGENSGGMEPYSIRFSDGSTFNYRNFDPFATPIKIIVNALERAETLAYRAEQGERLDDSEFAEVQAIVAVSVGSIAQSLRDANLAAGVDAAVDLWEDLQDPDSSGQIIKFLGKKAQAFLPNTYYKIQMLDNPVLSDPVTMEQFIRYRANPDDPLVPKQYTALGRPRTLSNPAAGLYYFNTATVEERKRGVPEKELEVEEFLHKLALVGDTHFTAPHKMTEYLGDIDLRTQVTKDGKETYYDRWMRYTHESELVNVLHSYRDLPMGTASVPGIAETAVRKVINQFRMIAFIRLRNEEANIPQKHESVLTRKRNAKTGQRSSDNIPFINRN